LVLRSFDFEQRDDGYSFISTKLYICVFYYYDTTYGLLLLSGGIIRYSVIVYIRYIFIIKKNKNISQSIQLKNIIEKQKHITVNTVTQSNRKTKPYHSQYSYKI
jgi:hypothetical protein